MIRYGPARRIGRIRWNLVVIEGGDGSGTTTQQELLKRNFLAFIRKQSEFLYAAEPGSDGHPRLFCTAEPTDGPAGVIIRRLLRAELTVSRQTLARLFAADRCAHLYGKGGIVEHCERGELTVSDRYTPSSLVYQGIDCGPALPQKLNAAFPLPELLIFLDVDGQTALERLKNRSRREIYEYLEYQEKVRSAYLELLPKWEQEGVKILKLDGKRPAEELSGEIWSAVRELPILNT